MGIEVITLLMFATLILLIFSGLSIAWCLGVTGVLFSIFMWGTHSLPIIATRVFDQANNYVILAAPLFIFMAYCLEESGMADELFEALYKWSGRLRGGLAAATVIICSILGACTGITATATVTMAVIAHPRMIERGYNKHLSIGTIASSGGLGILIPPSVPMVILAMMGGQSLGKLFMGGFTAGLLIALVFIIYIIIRAWLNPAYCPANTEKVSLKEKLVSLKALIAPFILIVAVLGFLILGITTPTEASAVGAIGSIIYLMTKKGRFNKKAIKIIFQRTAIVTGMALWIVFGATCFTAVFNALGSQDLVASMVGGINFSPISIVLIFFLILLVLGMFLDPIGIILIASPVMTPIVIQLGYDPIWFGVLFIVLIQIGYISPPFGYNLFYMKAADPSLEMKDIFISVLPFIGLMMLSVIFMIIFPEIILWLPQLVGK